MGRELATDASPQQTWTAIVSGKRGLALVSNGLPEAAVYDLPERPLALTLFRATSKTVFTDGQPEGQLPGKMTFDFWIVPLPGKVDRRQLCDYGQRIAAGLKTAQLRPPDLALYRRTKRLPKMALFLELQGRTIATSIRRVGEGMEVRVFNPENTKIESTLSFPPGPLQGSKFRTATLVDLESNPINKLKITGGKISIILKTKQIATIRLE